MLTIEKKTDGILHFSGRFDASQAEKATTALSEVEDSVTIDMSELEYISSMGLGVLVSTYKRLDQKGEKIRFTNLNAHIRDLFKYTSLDKVFEIVN